MAALDGRGPGEALGQHPLRAHVEPDLAPPEGIAPRRGREVDAHRPARGHGLRDEEVDPDGPRADPELERRGRHPVERPVGPERRRLAVRIGHDQRHEGRAPRRPARAPRTPARPSVSRKGNVRRRVKPWAGRASSSTGPNPSTARSALHSTRVASVRHARAMSWPRSLGNSRRRRPAEPLLRGPTPLPEDPRDLVRGVERVGVVDAVEAEVVEILALEREVVGELVRRVLAVVPVIEQGREELVERAAHRRLGPPAVPEPRERLDAPEVGRGEHQEAPGAEDPEDLLERVERVQVEVLEELAEEDGVHGRRRQRERRLLDLALADRDLALAAPLEEVGPGPAALDRVVQPDDLPAAGLGQRREVSGERPDVQEPPALARGQEPQRVLVPSPVVLEVAGLPVGQAAAPEGVDFPGDLVEVGRGGLVGGPGPEGHASLRYPGVPASPRPRRGGGPRPRRCRRQGCRIWVRVIFPAASTQKRYERAYEEIPMARGPGGALARVPRRGRDLARELGRPWSARSPRRSGPAGRRRRPPGSARPTRGRGRRRAAPPRPGPARAGSRRASTP